MGKIADKVFKERFSEETFNCLENLYFGSDSSHDQSEKVEADKAVDGISGGLENLEIVPDDWEDLASESD